MVHVILSGRVSAVFETLMALDVTVLIVTTSGAPPLAFTQKTVISLAALIAAAPSVQEASSP